MHKIKGVIFDMDGTLLDSCLAWKSALYKVLDRHGIFITEEEFVLLYQMTDAEIKVFLGEKIKAYALDCTATELFSALYQAMAKEYETTVAPKENALDFIKTLHKKDIPLCVATLTDRNLAKKVLERLGFLPYISFLLTGDDVGTSKASPKIFLEAASRLGYTPQEVAVFEDSLTAVKTASQAGFQVYGVYDPHQSFPPQEMVPFVKALIFHWGNFSWENEKKSEFP